MDTEEIRQLAPLEVAEVKDWLRHNPQSIRRICTRLAVEKVERLRGTDLKKSFAYRLIDEVGEAAIENYVAIQDSLAMPNSVEWSANAAVTPSQVNEEIESVMAVERHG